MLRLKNIRIHWWDVVFEQVQKKLITNCMKHKKTCITKYFISIRVVRSQPKNIAIYMYFAAFSRINDKTMWIVPIPRDSIVNCRNVVLHVWACYKNPKIRPFKGTFPQFCVLPWLFWSSGFKLIKLRLTLMRTIEWRNQSQKDLLCL